MIENKHITEYIASYRNGTIMLNKERIQLIDHIEKKILTRDDLYFDEEQIENYINFSEKYYFELDEWEKFITPFIFLRHKETDALYYDIFFLSMGRGAGKNGYISTLANYFISPLHGIKRYDVTLVANSEYQAKTSFMDVHHTILDNTTLTKHFKNGLAQIVGRLTNSVLKYATSNAKTKDGGREGCVIYDEVHEMEDGDIVDVFSGGLGKVADAREFFISTNGFVREGYYDSLFKRSVAVLEGKSEEKIFPYICKLNDASEVDDMDNWELANPALTKPFNKRTQLLFEKVKSQYLALVENPSSRENFMTKRMNLPETNLEKSIATYDELLATDQKVPDLTNRSCIGGLDYASIRDFAAVGLLFNIDGKYIWKTHSFARKEYLEKAKLKPPIYEWEKQGLLTIVNGPSIDPQVIVDWFEGMSEHYDIQKVVADNFRMDLLRPLFSKIDMEVEVIRNPKAAHALLAPRIEDGFANEKIIYGDNPLMRWYTNNVFVNIKKDGNKEFLKKDEHRRKTDGFQAFVHALWNVDEIDDYDYGESLENMNSLNF